MGMLFVRCDGKLHLGEAVDITRVIIVTLTEEEWTHLH